MKTLLACPAALCASLVKGRCRRATSILLLIGLTAVATAASGPTVLHVDDDAPPGGDGLTWESPYRFLQDAMDAARKPGSAVEEIRIAGGLYKPDRSAGHPKGTGDREASFELVSGVALRGGYAGFGAKDPDLRDIDTFETTFSGDLAGDDPVAGLPQGGDNSHSVVRGTDLAPGTLVDGLTISSGRNDIWPSCGCPIAESSGGGLRILGGALKLNQCRVQYNWAYQGGGGYFESVVLSVMDTVIEGNQVAPGGSGNGGGMMVTGGGLLFADCTFLRNRAPMASYYGGLSIAGGATGDVFRCAFIDNGADNGGGGAFGFARVSDCVFVDNHATTTAGALGVFFENCAFIDNGGYFGAGALGTGEISTVINCTFRGNSGNLGAVAGGGTIINCTFEENYADDDGGALHLSRASTIVNCLIRGNSADLSGGGVFVDHEDVSLVNCTIAENEADDGGGGVAGPARIVNCILWDSSPDQVQDPQSVRYSCIEGGWPGEGNIDDDPLFVGPDDFRLSAASPCIDAGDTTALPMDPFDLDDDGEVAEIIPLDLARRPRLTDRPATPDTGIPVDDLPVVDIGAYEFQEIVDADLDGDGHVGITDLLLLMDAWGPCPTGGCIGDLDRDGVVGTQDLLILLDAW